MRLAGIEKDCIRRHILLVRDKVVSRHGIMGYSLNMVLALVISSILTGESLLPFLRNLFISTLSVLAIVFSAYTYNDITDIEIDRLNNLDRPLVRGKASIKEARNVVILLAFSGFALSLLLNFTFVFLLFVFYALSLAYSFPKIRLKKRFLIKDLVIATGSAITSLLGGAAAGLISLPTLYLAILSFIGSITMTPLKDLRDLQGDQIYQVNTLPVIWGPRLTVRFLISIVFLAAIALLVGYLNMGFNYAFIILASIAFAAWLYILYPLSSRWKEYTGNPKVVSLVIKKIAPIVISLELITIFATMM